MVQLTGWDQYVLKEQAKKAKLEEAKDRPALREAEVVTVGHEIDWSSMNRLTTVGKIAHLAADHGWDVKVGESEYRTADAMYKGEVKLGVVKKHRWVQALSPDRKHHISVSADLKLLDGWPVQDLDEVKIHIDEFGIHE